jgi:orotate phosphoribosyltransferase
MDTIAPAKPAIVTCMPCNGLIEACAAKAYFAEMSKDLVAAGVPIVRIDPQQSSFLPYSFNKALCFALNLRSQGLCTHFAMLHSDVEPDAWWLDTLWSEMERTGAAWISAAAAICTPHGLTSTAVDHGNQWNPYYRITMCELHRLPETFCIDDVEPHHAELNHHLLLNTGCMLLDLRPDYWGQVGDRGELKLQFGMPTRIVYRPDRGGYEAQGESEDWYLSRQLAALGAKLYCTRKVWVRHHGAATFTTECPWGEWEHDESGDRADRLSLAAGTDGQARELSAIERDARPARVEGGQMITTEQLCIHTLALLSKLPPELNLAGVLGVSRKGMIPATILAERLHLPLGEAQGYLSHGFFANNSSRRRTSKINDADRATILVVDDAIGTGDTMLGVVIRLRRRYANIRFVLAAVMVPRADIKCVDYWGVVYDVGAPQELEFLNTPSAEEWAVDMDGVICEEPPYPCETDDEVLWTRHFETVGPLYLPRMVPVYAIVTSRLERYRDVTEGWLARWGVKYRQLIMHPAASVAERDSDPASHGVRKGTWFRDSSATIFVESNKQQADEIAAISGKAVICTSTGRLMLWYRGG